MKDSHGATYYHARDVETLPRAQLAALQLERLRATVQNAYDNVALYRKRFDAAGLAPADVKTLDDLARFPFTVKDDLRAAYPFAMFAVAREKIVRCHASSGTTGKPTVVGYTRADLETWAELMARSIACAGGRPGDILHNAYGYGLFTGGLGVHDGATRLGMTVVPVSGGLTERQVMLLADLGARMLACTPSYALNIAEVGERMGVDMPALPLAIGLHGAEPWTDKLRAELDRRLGYRAVDLYGLSEIIGPGVAVECLEARSGLHAWEDAFLCETIDPDTGEALAPGSAGELVITTLAKEAQPMIRYRTRDITRIETGRCACGRTHARIMRITGRSDDMLIIRGVNMYPSQVEALLVGRAGIAPHYQLVVAREGAMDTLTVEVEAAEGVEAADYARLGSGIEHHIKSLIGVSCRVAVKAPGAVPRSEGKAVRVRDLRKKT